VRCSEKHYDPACLRLGLAVASGPNRLLKRTDHAGYSTRPRPRRRRDQRQLRARLKSFIERLERLEEEKAGIAADIKEVYSEAKGTGFDVKVMRQVIRLRKMESDARRELEELLDLYMRALGMAV